MNAINFLCHNINRYYNMLRYIGTERIYFRFITLGLNIERCKKKEICDELTKCDVAAATSFGVQELHSANQKSSTFLAHTFIHS